MKLGLDEEQDAFLGTVRRLLETFCTPTRLAQAEESTSGLDNSLWAAMCTAGWTGLSVPSELDGLGASLETISLIVQEIGKFGCATPLVAAVQSGCLLSGAPDSPRVREVLLRLRDGDVISYAGLFDSRVKIEVQDGKYLATANSVPVLWGHLATAVVILGEDPVGALTVHVLEVNHETAMDPEKTLDNEVVGTLDISNVDVGEPIFAIGRLDLLDQWLAPLRVLQGSLLTGCARKLLEMTLEYVEVRKQFGRVLGSLPTVHQVLADVAIEVEGAELAVGEAAARLDNADGAYRTSCVASYWSGYVAQSAAVRVAQLHGAIGFMKEYPLQLFFRRAKAGQLRLGTLRSQQDVLARILLPAVAQSRSDIAMMGVEIEHVTAP